MINSIVNSEVGGESTLRNIVSADEARDYTAVLAEQTAKALAARPFYCGRIASHSGWKRGKWVNDTCACGHVFQVPTGSTGKYQCNCCADRAEGLCDY